MLRVFRKKNLTPNLAKQDLRSSKDRSARFALEQLEERRLLTANMATGLEVTDAPEAPVPATVAPMSSETAEATETSIDALMTEIDLDDLEVSGIVEVSEDRTQLSYALALNGLDLGGVTTAESEEFTLQQLEKKYSAFRIKPIEDRMERLQATIDESRADDVRSIDLVDVDGNVVFNIVSFDTHVTSDHENAFDLHIDRAAGIVAGRWDASDAVPLTPNVVSMIEDGELTVIVQFGDSGQEVAPDVVYVLPDDVATSGDAQFNIFAAPILDTTSFATGRLKSFGPNIYAMSSEWPKGGDWDGNVQPFVNAIFEIAYTVDTQSTPGEQDDIGYLRIRTTNLTVSAGDPAFRTIDGTYTYGPIQEGVTVTIKIQDGEGEDRGEIKKPANWTVLGQEPQTPIENGTYSTSVSTTLSGGLELSSDGPAVSVGASSNTTSTSAIAAQTLKVVPKHSLSKSKWRYLLSRTTDLKPYDVLKDLYSTNGFLADITETEFIQPERIPDFAKGILGGQSNEVVYQIRQPSLGNKQFIVFETNHVLRVLEAEEDGEFPANRVFEKTDQLAVPFDEAKGGVRRQTGFPADRGVREITRAGGTFGLATRSLISHLDARNT